MVFEEGSFVDCTIEDTKLRREEEEGRESRGLKGLCFSSVKHQVLQVRLKSGDRRR
jgi:hypothetical protein